MNKPNRFLRQEPLLQLVVALSLKLLDFTLIKIQAIRNRFRQNLNLKVILFILSTAGVVFIRGLSLS